MQIFSRLHYCFQTSADSCISYCLYKVMSGNRWPKGSILFHCILLPHHASSMRKLHLLRMQSKHSPPPSNYIICVHTFCNHEQKPFLSYFPSDLQANNFNPWSWEPPLTARKSQYWTSRKVDAPMHNRYRRNLTKNATTHSLSQSTNTEWKLMSWTVTRPTN